MAEAMSSRLLAGLTKQMPQQERNTGTMFTNTKAFSGFAVDDLATARQFYGDTLGIQTSEQYGLLTLHLAGGRAHSSTPSRTTHRRRTRSSTSPSTTSARRSMN